MSRTTITSITAREAYSDRGLPAITVTVKTENGAVGQALCSGGISVGTHEIEFAYDGGAKWGGKGVKRAVYNVNNLIAPKLIGMDTRNQSNCDSVMLAIGKGILGGNATAAVSTAILNAGAAALDIPLYEHIGGIRGFTLPVPGCLTASGSTRYGGSVHAGYKPSYSFVAYDFSTFTEASTGLWEVYMNWMDRIQKDLGIKMQITAGLAIPKDKLEHDYQLWDMMADVIVQSGYEGMVGMQVDVAANSFYNKKTQLYEGIFCHRPKTREDMITLAIKMAKEYPFVSIEDPLHEDDFEGFAEITKNVDIQIVGDDLLATNPERVKKAIRMGSGNTVRIVTGQIGTVTEAAEVVQLATENNFGISPCGERGEGVDICDYAVGYNAGTIREYGLCFSGNRLLKIEEELGSRAKFLGKRGIRGSRFQLR
ncbi:MAG: enolase C-terminal domain-like protein [Sporomusa sp.]